MSTSASRPSSGNSSPRPLESPGRQSPWRHHQRATSANRIVKETSNARAEYSNSDEDGASQRRINQYLIKEEIGRGSFGAVHLAVDQYDEEYAVKEFSKSRLRKRAMSEMLRRKRQGSGHEGWPVMKRDKSKGKLADTQASFDLIKEEIAIMKKLNHVNLVSLIEVLDDPEEDSLYMVLEYCKKGVIMKVDLEDDSEPYDEESCRCWFRDLILGIEYLHAQGVVHRDIKPDNLLLTEDDTLKIVDFGVSEMFEKNTEMRIAKSAGSPAFMAPELVSTPHGDVMGQPADIWSMGVTLYCLRYGRVPFKKDNVVDLYDAISHDKVDVEKENNKDFKDLMTRLLEKDPGKRITMPILREHPWVTRQGEDPLMPASENCSEIITVPTEEEKNQAITNNLGRTLAVLKAVNKFKFLIAKKRPYLLDSCFFGPGSQMSRDTNEMLGNRRMAGQLLHSIFKSPSQSSDGSEDKPAMGSKAKVMSPESAVDDPESPSGPHLQRRETGRGQAQDPTEHHVFIDIGAGPVARVEGEEEFAAEAERVVIISESPPSAGYSIFPVAYNGEVRRIRREKGHKTMMYLTRRVEGSGEISHADVWGDHHESAPPAGGPGKSKLAELLGKAAGIKKEEDSGSAQPEKQADREEG